MTSPSNPIPHRPSLVSTAGNHEARIRALERLSPIDLGVPLMAAYSITVNSVPDTADDEFHMLAFDLGTPVDNDLFAFDAANYAFIALQAGIYWAHAWYQVSVTPFAHDLAIALGTNYPPLTYNPATNFGTDPGSFYGGSHPPGSWAPPQSGDYSEDSVEIKNFNVFQPGEMPLAFQLFYKHNGPSMGVDIIAGIEFIVWPGTSTNHGP